MSPPSPEGPPAGSPAPFPPTHRRVSGLLSVALAPSRPLPLPRHLSPVQAAGLRYERSLRKALPAGFRPGVWLSYTDRNGQGWCQMDWVGNLLSRLVVLEVKLTYTPNAFLQLEELYFPVLIGLCGAVPVGVQVCRNLTRQTPRDLVHADLPSAVRAAAGGSRAVWHWLQ